MEVKCTNPRNKGKKIPGTKKADGGRRTKRNATLTNLRVQRKQNVGTWPAQAPKQHTTGQESAPMLPYNEKRYKRKHSCATDGQHTTKEHQNTQGHIS